jgi:hypothetical protein
MKNVLFQFKRENDLSNFKETIADTCSDINRYRLNLSVKCEDKEIELATNAFGAKVIKVENEIAQRNKVDRCYF